jgi:hypothetical protein
MKPLPIMEQQSKASSMNNVSAAHYSLVRHFMLAWSLLTFDHSSYVLGGDGIMSAIDFYLDVGTTTGKHGEKRVVITFNGKFLPFIEQKSDDNGAKSPRD